MIADASKPEIELKCWFNYATAAESAPLRQALTQVLNVFIEFIPYVVS